MKNLYKVLVSTVFIATFGFGQVDYQTQIQTIFNNNCTSCHINGGAYYGGLDLSSYDSLMVGDSQNGPVVIAGDHASSLLWQKVNSGAMPPQNNPDLSTDEVSLIAQWIDEGAIWTPACPINCPSDCTLGHLAAFAVYLILGDYSNSMLFDIDYNGTIDIIDLLIFSDIVTGYSDYYDCSD